MTKAQQISNETAKNSKGSSHPVADKVKNVLHESVDNLAQRAAATEESLRHTAQSSSETLSAKQAEVKARWENSSIKQYASENPVATAGIAFAAGMLLTTFLKRK